ncbi:hypothetical protein HDV06_001027 [Boothiomyces sp. JEL0866]|nr:hypothetical protein HDV06_001027 [Boothiomyces sp. JEL0866]
MSEAPVVFLHSHNVDNPLDICTDPNCEAPKIPIKPPKHKKKKFKCNDPACLNSHSHSHQIESNSVIGRTSAYSDFASTVSSYCSSCKGAPVNGWQMSDEYYQMVNQPKTTRK